MVKFAIILYNSVVSPKQKMKFKNKIVNIFVITTILFLISLPAAVFATSTGEVYLSPASTSVTIGNQISLALRVNPGTSIDTVQATVNFNSSYLSFISSSTSGSPFSCLADSVSSTSVGITCYLTGSTVSSDSLIKTLTFNSLSTGTANLSITGAETASAGTPYYPTVAGASVTINPQPVSQPTSPTPAPSKTYSYAPKTTSTTPTQTKPIQPINLNIKFSLNQIYSLKALVSITSSSNASYLVEYGTDQSNLSSTTPTTQPTSKTTVTLDNLSPKTTYYYQVIAIDSNNQTQTFKLSSFTTKGVSFSLQLLSDNYQPITNTVVYLSGTTIKQKTDSNGNVTFNNLSPGNLNFFFYSGGKKYSQQVYIASEVNNFNLIAQKQTVVIGNYKLASSLSKPSSVVNLAILMVIILLIIFLVIRAKIK